MESVTESPAVDNPDCWACGGSGCEDYETGEGCRNCMGTGKAPAPEVDENSQEVRLGWMLHDLHVLASRFEEMGIGRDWRGTNPAELLRTIAEAIEYDAVSHGAPF